MTQSKGKASASELRKVRRVPVKLNVDWKHEGHFLFERATNLSEHGIFLETDKPKEPGTLIDLTFTLPDSSRRIEVRGEVIWTNPLRPGKSENLNPGMGIRFVNLTEVDKDLIMSLVKRLAVL